MLTAADIPIMPIDKLPEGQYGCTGLVINLSQDCHLPSELDVIVDFFKQTVLISTLNSLPKGNIITQVKL